MTNNKLIAEFMGMTYGDPNDNSVMTQTTPQGNEIVPIESMNYHKSWDWLMPVISKCRTESNSENDYWEGIYYTLEECDIDITYSTVVNFIKRTNLNQQI